MISSVGGILGSSMRQIAAVLVLSLAYVAIAAAQEVIADPPSRVARLAHTEGEVTIRPAGTDEWAEAVLNRPLTSGDRLWTESGARAELQIGSAAIYLDERSSFGFVELDDEVMQMSLTGGAATIRVRRRTEDETIQIETPNAAISLTEPGEYHIEVDAQADQTIVKTRHGQAEVFGSNQTHLVRADEQATFAGLENLTVQVDRLGPRTGFESWANDQERLAAESTSAQYVSQDVVGYTDLDEHGEWLHEPEYGHVWRPLHVAHDWAPYRDGRWAWVSPWGWTWVDHARWGFAPFHYGRWAHVRDRWCWVPGPRHLRPVYAPALVGWVGGPHVSVSVSIGRGVGWFPLGPREVYVPGYRHSPRYIRHINRSNTIIVNNTYITNVYSGRHRGGFDYRYSHRPFAVTAVERNHFLGGRPVRGRVLRVSGEELRQWRHSPRPPALTPDRNSVLIGDARRAPPTAHAGRNHLNRASSNRITFDTERRIIERNGGRPVSRSHLYTDDPKQRGDFNRGQSRLGTARTSAGSNDSRRAGGVAQDGRIQSAPARETSVRSFRQRQNLPSSTVRSQLQPDAQRSEPSRDLAGQALRDANRTRQNATVDRARESRVNQRDSARFVTPRGNRERPAAVPLENNDARARSRQPRMRESTTTQPQRAWRSSGSRPESNRVERAAPAPRAAPQSSRRESSFQSQPRTQSAPRQSSAPRASSPRSTPRSAPQSRGSGHVRSQPR